MAEDVVQYDPETDGGFEHFGLDYYLPLAFTAKYARAELPCQVEIRAVLEDGRYRVENLKATRRRKGESITLENLQDIRVAALVAEAGKAATTLLHRIGRQTTPGFVMKRRGLQKIAIPSEGWIDDFPEEATSEHVAVIYRIAYACSRPPTQAVAEAFDVSRATAGRWIADARDQGFLGPAIERQAGERKRRRKS